MLKSLYLWCNGIKTLLAGSHPACQGEGLPACRIFPAVLLFYPLKQTQRAERKICRDASGAAQPLGWQERGGGG